MSRIHASQRDIDNLRQKPETLTEQEIRAQFDKAFVRGALPDRQELAHQRVIGNIIGGGRGNR